MKSRRFLGWCLAGLLTLGSAVADDGMDDPDFHPDAPAHHPVEITLKQGESKPIPGTNERLRLTIDKITRSGAQIQVDTVTTSAKATSDTPARVTVTPLVQPKVVAKGTRVHFVHDGAHRELILAQTITSMLGMNYAVVVYIDTPAQTPTPRDESGEPDAITPDVPQPDSNDGSATQEDAEILNLKVSGPF